MGAGYCLEFVSKIVAVCRNLRNRRSMGGASLCVFTEEGVTNIRSAGKSIVIIDNYIDETILVHLTKSLFSRLLLDVESLMLNIRPLLLRSLRRRTIDLSLSIMMWFIASC
jgi:hypothetical protein